MKNNKYEVIIEYQAQIDLKFWRENDKKKFKKINRFITECEQNPYTGIGIPKRLYDNFMSRRINKEHRFLYIVLDNCVWVIQCKGHDRLKINNTGKIT